MKKTTVGILGVFLVAGICGFSYIALSSVNAISIDETEFKEALQRGCKAGLTTKCTEELFRPNSTITRQEFAKFLNVFTAGSVTDLPKCSFNDSNLFDPTLSTHIYDSCVKGYIKGSQGNFMPQNLLTRSQLVVIIVRTFRGILDESVSPWYKNYLSIAQEKGLLTDIVTLANSATRKESLVMLFRLSKLQNTSIDISEETNTSTQTSNSYLKDYSIQSDEYGTNTVVTTSNGKRTITTNSLPNHETGVFPNSGNPNTITAVNVAYAMTLTPVKASTTQWAMVPGVALNGIKFEPETAETVTCTDGQTFKIEAIQPLVNLGLDDQNAHVQPNGLYHYHAISKGLVAAFDTSSDLVLVGFASDGFPMYYSKSGAYKSSYKLKSGNRSVSGTCTYRNKNRDVSGAYDGSLVSDREYDPSLGTLDKCNGAVINGSYSYLLTDEYPYISRCVTGTPDSSFLPKKK